jgi:hypothetical protein
VGGVAAQFFTNTGAVLTGGKLYTYAAGTTTPATTFTSSQGTTAWTNPIVLDAAGRVSGSGEIWLTDGINYKFLLKDSNDVLIATYDNISGINSNSVSFTNQQQIITATANQTVFNLSISYQVATNSLSVFVDGVNQYGPGAQYAYTETSSTSVTFTNGLHVGAVVKFTTTQQQGAGAVNASQVTYNPAGAGAVATNVQAKLRQYVSVLDYGAVGDSTTNDTAAFTAAQNAAAFIEVPAGLICKVDAGLSYQKFFGSGTVFEPGRTWQLSRSPQTAQTQKVYRDTFGTYESAAGASVVVNSGNGQSFTNTEVEGDTTQNIAIYGGFDHVGQFAAAYSFASQTYPNLGATYSSTTLTQTGLSAFVVERGVLIKTGHTPWYVGAVQSKSGDTITVDGWYTQTTGVAVTPANGTGGTINPNTKIWAHNANLHLPNTGDATAGAGFELGLLLDKTGVGANSVGFDVIGLSGEDASAHYRSRGNATNGFYSTNATQASFYASQSTSLGGDREGFRSATSKIGFRSSADAVGISIENPTTSALRTIVSGGTKTQLGISGGFDILSLTTVSAAGGATLSSTVTLAILTGSTVTLPLAAATGNAGRLILLSNKSGGTCTVSGNGTNIDGSASLAISSGANKLLASDGTQWLVVLNG